MMLVMNDELARILSPFLNNMGIFEALGEYAMAKIKHINEQFHHVDPTDVAQIGKLQGQYMELKSLLSLKSDIKSVLEKDKW